MVEDSQTAQWDRVISALEEMPRDEKIEIVPEDDPRPWYERVAALGGDR